MRATNRFRLLAPCLATLLCGVAPVSTGECGSAKAPGSSEVAPGGSRLASVRRPVAAPVPAPRPPEAERLLAAMDAKIRRAKALRIAFEVRFDDDGKGEPSSVGSLLIADRNRFRFESEDMWRWTRVVVSDGKRIGSDPPRKNAPPFPPLRDWHNEVVKSCIGRLGGWTAPILALDLADRAGGKRPGADDLPRVSNAKTLPDEKVDGTKARVVAYDLPWRDFARQGVTITVRV
jgi:hypothetical protein